MWFVILIYLMIYYIWLMAINCYNRRLLLVFIFIVCPWVYLSACTANTDPTSSAAANNKSPSLPSARLASMSSLSTHTKTAAIATSRSPATSLLSKIKDSAKLQWQNLGSLNNFYKEHFSLIKETWWATTRMSAIIGSQLYRIHTSTRTASNCSIKLKCKHRFPPTPQLPISASKTHSDLLRRRCSWRRNRSRQQTRCSTSPWTAILGWIGRG